MGFFDRFFKKGSVIEQTIIEQPILDDIIELPVGEIVTISDGVLDVSSRESIQKFKHNLTVLIEQAKKEGRINNFKLIREDDYFPIDWQWQVASKNTCMEKSCLGLSIAIKYQYALEKAGIKTTLDGFQMSVDSTTLNQALTGVDKYIGAVYLPMHFRSTKHFTINTPLGITGNYNTVVDNRNFIVIDDIDNFLHSGFAYSVAYHDAYLDVSHKGLPLSNNAVILIEQSKYETLKQDETLMQQLEGKKVVIFRGDEVIAINMVLTELGVLPSEIGSLYADYDNEIKTIIDRSIRDLATDNKVLFDRSHAGSLTLNRGHFSNYYDEKNRDYDYAMNEFIEYLRSRFPDHQSLFTIKSIQDLSFSEEIVEKIGMEPLLSAINDFNDMTLKKFRTRYAEYRRDREDIEPEVEEVFKTTIRIISGFYMDEVRFDTIEERIELEEQIRLFFQADTVKEQLAASKKIVTMLNKRQNQEVVEEIEMTSLHHL